MDGKRGGCKTVGQFKSDTVGEIFGLLSKSKRIVFSSGLDNGDSVVDDSWLVGFSGVGNWDRAVRIFDFVAAWLVGFSGVGNWDRVVRISDDNDND